MTDSDLVKAVTLLGLAVADLQGVRTQSGFAALKEKAKRGYKAAAMRLHPDRTGGDFRKAEDFKLITAFMDELDRMEPVGREQKYRTAVLSVNLTVRVPTVR